MQRPAKITVDGILGSVASGARASSRLVCPLTGICPRPACFTGAVRNWCRSA